MTIIKRVQAFRFRLSTDSKLIVKQIVWGGGGRNDEDLSLLEYDATSTGKELPEFRRSFVPQLPVYLHSTFQ